MSIASILFLFSFVLSLSLNGFFLFRHGPLKESRLRACAVKASISVLALTYVLILIEAFFYFYCPSDNFGYTLTTKRWYKKYWKTNSDGFRDREYDESDFSGKKIVTVLGDSFAAGQGIKNPKDRFSDILREKLGAGWHVVNLGRMGVDTQTENNILARFPYAPNVLILSYLINDIDGAAHEKGLWTASNRRPSPPPLVKPLMEVSYLADFVYWRFSKNIEKMNVAYNNFVYQAFTTEEVWRSHAGDLLKFVNYAEAHNARLIVVVFPILTNVVYSKTFTSKVVDLFQKHNTEVVDMASLLEGRDPGSFVVSAWDAHPNEALHREVADILYPLVARPR